MSSFIIPEPYTSESADIKRDEDKRLRSPPSFFFAQTQALSLAARYFNDGRLRPQTMRMVAAKHRHRIHGALFGQVMAAFEFCLKDYIAQLVDKSDMYDDRIQTSDWIAIDKSRVLARRDSTGGVGGILIHPLLGWHESDKVNERYKGLFDHPIFGSREELLNMDRLWILRHSVAHNAGFVTAHDAYRLQAPRLSERAVRIDEEFLRQAIDFLRAVVRRMGDPIGTAVLRKWFATRAVGVWEQDQDVYTALKLVTTVRQARTDPLPKITEAMYARDQAAAAAAGAVA